MKLFSSILSVLLVSVAFAAADTATVKPVDSATTVAAATDSATTDSSTTLSTAEPATSVADSSASLQELKKKNRIPDIDRMYTLAQFSPKRQVETMRKLKSIKKSLNNRFLQAQSDCLLYMSYMSNILKLAEDVNPKWVDSHRKELEIQAGMYESRGGSFGE